MQSSKEYMRSLHIIHGAMLVGQVMFIATVHWIIAPKRVHEHDFAFNLVGGTTLVLGFALAYLLPLRIINDAKTKRGLREKLEVYRSALLINWAILEGICLFIGVCYMMTGEFAFVCAAIFTMVAFVLNRPTLNKLICKLDLDKSEQRTLENSRSAI